MDKIYRILGKSMRSRVFIMYFIRKGRKKWFRRAKTHQHWKLTEQKRLILLINLLPKALWLGFALQW